MPIECTLLQDAPVSLAECPKCHAKPFVPFLRGGVQRSKRRFGIGPKQDYCALICGSCHEIVGHESPPTTMKKLMIECPHTREYVFTGLVLDEVSFAGASLRSNQVQCPHCGEKHTWNKEDVTLVDEDQKPN